jgi:hypothetical protein
MSITFSTFFNDPSGSNIGNLICDNGFIYTATSTTLYRISLTNSSNYTSVEYDSSGATNLSMAIYNNKLYYILDTSPNLYYINSDFSSSRFTIISNMNVPVSIAFNTSGTLYYATNTTVNTIDMSGNTTLIATNTGSRIFTILFTETNIMYILKDSSNFFLNILNANLTITPVFPSYPTAYEIYDDFAYYNGYIYLLVTSFIGGVQSLLIQSVTNQNDNYVYGVGTNFNNTYGIIINSNDIYYTYQQRVYFSVDPLCFNEGTKILYMNKQLVDKYIRVELLKVGDFVKTYKHGYRKIHQIIKGSFKNNPKKWNMCMYKMAKTAENTLTDDLIVTGGHSILVDAISDEEQKKYDEMGIPSFSKLTIDNKHLLLSCCSDQFTAMQDTGRYNYYHLLLENNDDEEERFGIWANGILTETPNVKTVSK